MSFRTRAAKANFILLAENTNQVGQAAGDGAETRTQADQIYPFNHGAVYKAPLPPVPGHYQAPGLADWRILVI
jgi:hypothetical protein